MRYAAFALLIGGMRPETVNAVLRAVSNAGPNGCDVEHFAEGFFRNRRTRSDRRTSGGARVLARAVRAGLLDRVGTGRYAVHRVTPDGELFLQNFGRSVAEVPQALTEPSELAYVVGDSLSYDLEPGFWGPTDAPDELGTDVESLGASDAQAGAQEPR